MAVQAPDKYAQAGFTLLEVMAAIAILGIGIVMIIQLFSGSLGLVKSSDDYTRKVLLARQKMTETLSSGSLKEGSANGVTEGGLAWAVEVSPYELKKVERAESKVFKVVVSAEGQGPRKKTYTLTTLKAVF
ncbi:MAG: hypothetical protein A2052_03905 [Deltaproteobacteria bacterium GWA2_54_12]|nr:MAG: hypothetical protein A2052_03905 [Deltaproteobacteria bacterium GWA2_54_12]